MVDATEGSNPRTENETPKDSQMEKSLPHSQCNHPDYRKVSASWRPFELLFVS